MKNKTQPQSSPSKQNAFDFSPCLGCGGVGGLALDVNEQRAGVTFTPVCCCGFRFISSALEMRGGLGAAGGGGDGECISSPRAPLRQTSAR